MKVEFIVPAAGMGSRLGAQLPKALVLLAGEPILIRTLRRLSDSTIGWRAWVAIPEDASPLFENALSNLDLDIEVRFYLGGAERQYSVANGLKCLATDTEYVVIHDAARPFVPVSCIVDVLNAAEEYGAATLAFLSADTILESDEEGFLINTPDRKHVWACQTPQAFRADIIRMAYSRVERTGILFTDDATLVHSTGQPVKLVTGATQNFKITTPQDLAVAEFLLREGLC